MISPYIQYPHSLYVGEELQFARKAYFGFSNGIVEGDEVKKYITSSRMIDLTSGETRSTIRPLKMQDFFVAIPVDCDINRAYWLEPQDQHNMIMRDDYLIEIGRYEYLAIWYHITGMPNNSTINLSIEVPTISNNELDFTFFSKCRAEYNRNGTYLQTDNYASHKILANVYMPPTDRIIYTDVPILVLPQKRDEKLLFNSMIDIENEVYEKKILYHSKCLHYEKLRLNCQLFI